MKRKLFPQQLLWLPQSLFISAVGRYQFIGSNVFEFPWNSAAILLLSLCTIVLMFVRCVFPTKFISN